MQNIFPVPTQSENTNCVDLCLRIENLFYGLPEGMVEGKFLSILVRITYVCNSSSYTSLAIGEGDDPRRELIVYGVGNGQPSKCHVRHAMLDGVFLL